MTERAILADIVVNLLGLCGVGAYLLHLHRTRTRSPLENRLLLFFWNLALLLLVRTAFWAKGEPTHLQTLVFVPATLLPLASLLLSECLIRRHAPVALKAATVAGSGVFLLHNLIHGLHDTWLIAFLAYLVAVLGSVVTLLMTRNKTSLSTSENRLVNAFAVASLFAICLAISDFRREIGLFPVRMGAIGGLLLVYVFVRRVRRNDTKRVVVREILNFLLRGTLLGLLIAMLMGTGDDLNWQEMTFAMACASAFVLQFMILDQLASIMRYDREQSVQNWMTQAPVTSRSAFLASMNRLPQLGGMRVLEGDLVKKYDETVLSSILCQDKVVSLRQAKFAIRTGQSGYEQIVDLLETHQMTHVCLLQIAPLTLLACQLPEVGGSGFGAPELRMIQRFSSLVLDKVPA